MSSYRRTSKKVARKVRRIAQIRIVGPDRKGIIATVTSFLFKNNCNIEDIDQRILEGTLIMNMLVDYSDRRGGLSSFLIGLRKAASSVGCEASFKPLLRKTIKRIAVLVTKESHCLEGLLKKTKTRQIRGKVVVIIGNHPDLKPIARKYRIPFYYIPSQKKKEHETKILTLLKDYDVDLIVLARYMQILSPEFIFRYEGRIINIHPSLLPAFPGPRSYQQAYNKGVEIVGVTAHFVTTDLDEGPIIAQDCFRVDKTRDTVEHFIQRGKRLEAGVLTRAVKLFSQDRLSLRRGKVIEGYKLHQLIEKTQSFYR